jgi:hypothetical protein
LSLVWFIKDNESEDGGEIGGVVKGERVLLKSGARDGLIKRDAEGKLWANSLYLFYFGLSFDITNSNYVLDAISIDGSVIYWALFGAIGFARSNDRKDWTHI